MNPIHGVIRKRLHDYFVFDIGCKRNPMNPDVVKAQFSISDLAKAIERSIGEVALSQLQQCTSESVGPQTKEQSELCRAIANSNTSTDERGIPPQGSSDANGAAMVRRQPESKGAY